MKKIITCLVTLCAFVAVNAQTNQPITNGDFEEWTTSGYGPFATTTCTDWNTLGINLGYFTYNLADINRTNDSQNGSYAAFIESSKLDNITATAVQSLIDVFDTAGIISNYFDFANTVFPGFMMKGEIDIMTAAQTFFTLAMNLSSFISNIDSTFNLNDISSLVSMVNDIDFSSILSNGMPVEGTPDQMSGYYKYTLGAIDTTLGHTTDRAAAFLLGTYYDPSSHTRKIAGGGASLLTAQEAYTSFDVDFISLSQSNADSVYIFFVSSLYNGLNGSKLYIDNLSMTIKECNEVENISYTLQDQSAVVSWNDNDAAHYEVEYGPTGFAIGDGTRATTYVPQYTISTSGTIDVYVRTVCDLTNYSGWSDALTISLGEDNVDEQSVYKTSVSPNPSTGRFVINSDFELFNINIYNELGQKVNSYDNCENGFSFNIEQEGMYYVVIISSNSTETHKVITTK